MVGLPDAVGSTRRSPTTSVTEPAPGGARRGKTPAKIVGVASDLAEDQLEAVITRGAPHRLLDQIPPSLRGWLLPVNWDRDRLWSIDRPCARVAIDELRWHYDLPWWRGNDGSWFQVTPRQFMETPERFPEHVRRVEQADLRYPLHALRRKGRTVILDGIHRLVRTDRLGWTHVEVVFLKLEDVAAIVTTPSARP